MPGKEKIERKKERKISKNKKGGVIHGQASLNLKMLDS